MLGRTRAVCSMLEEEEAVVDSQSRSAEGGNWPAGEEDGSQSRREARSPY